MSYNTTVITLLSLLLSLVIATLILGLLGVANADIIVNIIVFVVSAILIPLIVYYFLRTKKRVEAEKDREFKASIKELLEKIEKITPKKA